MEITLEVLKSLCLVLVSGGLFGIGTINLYQGYWVYGVLIIIVGLALLIFQ